MSLEIKVERDIKTKTKRTEAPSGPPATSKQVRLAAAKARIKAKRIAWLRATTVTKPISKADASAKKSIKAHRQQKAKRAAFLAAMSPQQRTELHEQERNKRAARFKRKRHENYKRAAAQQKLARATESSAEKRARCSKRRVQKAARRARETPRQAKKRRERTKIHNTRTRAKLATRGDDWPCSTCSVVFATRKEMRAHRKACKQTHNANATTTRIVKETVTRDNAHTDSIE